MFFRPPPYPLSTLSTLIHLLVLIITCISSSRGQLFDLSDNTPNDFELGNVDRRTSSSSDHQAFTYSLMSSPWSDLFKVDATTGQLSTNQPIDRDLLCKSRDLCCQLTDFPSHFRHEAMRACTLALSVSIKESAAATPRLHQVKIRIRESNDHAPEFKNPPVQELTDATLRSKFILPDNAPDEPPTLILNVSESISTDYRIQLPLAEDIDAPPFNVQSYYLEPSNSIGDIRRSSDLPVRLDVIPELSSDHSSSRIRQLDLVFTSQLDRESVDIYEFRLLAVDGGHIPLTGTLNILINVSDTNDHAPKFSQSVYEATVSESLPAPVEKMEVLRVEASDADAGVNSIVRYRFADSPQVAPGFGVAGHPSYWFTLNQETGALYLRRQLDYETKRQHRFHVVAYNPIQQSGQPRLTPVSSHSSTATVIVNVKNVDDEAPKIVIDYANTNSADQFKAIKENSKEKYFVAFVTVSDPDCDVDGSASGSSSHQLASVYSQQLCANPVTCRLNNSDQESTYRLELDHAHLPTPSLAKRYILTTLRPLDREQARTERIVVVCTDAGSPPKTSSDVVIVHVIDENDSSPQLRVTDHNGSPVRRVDLLQRIGGDYPPIPLVNAYLANLTTFAVYLSEDQPRGTLVARIKAHDPDSGSNGQVSFSLPNGPLVVDAVNKERLPGRVGPDGKIDVLSSLTATQHFAIDPVSGDLTLRTPIDREPLDSPTALDHIYLLVEATDHGDEPRSSLLLLDINIEDVNDNKPIFLQPEMDFSIKENVPAPAIVGEIEVTDRDLLSEQERTLQRPNRLQLRIDPGHTSRHKLPFVLHRNSMGRYFLNTTRALDRELEEAFKFTVIATDNDNRVERFRKTYSPHRSRTVHTATAIITVRVVDANDNEPEIIYPNRHTQNSTIHHVSIREPVGHEIFTINAKDRDAGLLNGKFHFELSSSLSGHDSHPFDVDRASGVVRVRRLLHSDDLGEHRLHVVVRDEGDPSLETSLVMRLQVDNSQPRGSVPKAYAPDLPLGQASSSGSSDRFSSSRQSHRDYYNDHRRLIPPEERDKPVSITEVILFVFVAIILAFFIVLIVIFVLCYRHSKSRIFSSSIPKCVCFGKCLGGSDVSSSGDGSDVKASSGESRRKVKRDAALNGSTSNEAAILDSQQQQACLLQQQQASQVYADTNSLFAGFPAEHHHNQFVSSPQRNPQFAVPLARAAYDDQRLSQFYSATNLNAPPYRYYARDSMPPHQVPLLSATGRGNNQFTVAPMFRPETSLAINMPSMPDVVDPALSIQRKQCFGYSNQFNDCANTADGLMHPSTELNNGNNVSTFAYAQDRHDQRRRVYLNTYNTGRQAHPSEAQLFHHFQPDSVSPQALGGGPRRFLSGHNYATCPEVDFQPIDEDTHHPYQRLASPIHVPTLGSKFDPCSVNACQQHNNNNNNNFLMASSISPSHKMNDMPGVRSRLTPWRSDPSLCCRDSDSTVRRPLPDVSQLEADSGVLLDCGSNAVSEHHHHHHHQQQQQQHRPSEETEVQADQDYAVSFPQVQASFV